MTRRLGSLLLACLLVALSAAIQRAISASAQPALHGLVLTQEMYQPPGPTGWPVHAYVSRPIRAVATLRYTDATHWRVEGHYLSPPHDRFLLRNGTLATPFLPFPGSVVRQGRIIRHFNAQHHLVTIELAESDGMNPLTGNVRLYLDNHPTSSLAALLRWERRCRTASMQGTREIAGRRADVIDFGPDQCNRNSEAAFLVTGREVAWLDTSTLVLLRLDRFFPTTNHLLERRTTTRVTFR